MALHEDNIPESEITPEMEIAGARFLCEYYPEATGLWDGSGIVDRAMARDLFLTMWRASGLMRSRNHSPRPPSDENSP